MGDRAVAFLELGPAHTGGDTIVHVPDAGTVFTGDLLFIDGTPIVWASLSNWITACDRILELDATHARPRPRSGHRRLGRARRAPLSRLRRRPGG